MWYFVCALLPFVFGQCKLWAHEDAAGINDGKTSPMQKIEELVIDTMSQGNIPGLFLILIEDGQVILKKGYGYADLKKQRPVTADTLFEMGSTTKAFTALAILKLAQEGHIDLLAPVHTYLPWFCTRHEGKDASICVQDCLFHTSGIPFQTLMSLQASAKGNALEETVKRLGTIQLNYPPSTKFEYATINYDVLGLLIQTVSGRSYEDYMHHEILEPLGLKHSLFERVKAYQLPDMATGYKIEYLKARPFVAPTYRGNTPAGYLISNGHDIGHWLLYQINPSGPFHDLILASQALHQPVHAFGKDSFYTAGWFHFLTEAGEFFSHPGNNPNFSSYFAFSPKHQIGVAVLTNINSAYTMGIGQSALSLLLDEAPDEMEKDTLQTIDFISTSSVALSCLILILLLGLIFRRIQDFRQRKRRFYTMRLLPLIGSVLVFVILGYILYDLPALFLAGLNWKVATLWGPTSLPMAVGMLYVLVFTFFSYLHVLHIFPKNLSFGFDATDALGDK